MSTDLNIWQTRLDKVKTEFGLKTDVELARLLGITPAVLAHVRAGRNDLSLASKIVVMDKLGYSWTRDSVLALLPPAVRDAAAAWERKAIEKRVREPDPRTEKPVVASYRRRLKQS